LGLRKTFGRRRVLWVGAAITVLVGVVAITIAFTGAVRAAQSRISGNSDVIVGHAGRLEFASAGHGPPLLMIHGTGGGFDQGLLFSRAISARGIRIIAPSRFGYLRSDFPPDPSSERQADAFVELLDRLKLRRVAVAGGSAGALSAVQFALRHPDRTSALILIVPAANVEGQDPNAMSPLQEWIVRRLVTSDFAYWAARTAAPGTITGFLLATDPALLDTVSDGERQRAKAILDAILPIRARSRGMLNDAKLAGHPARIDFRDLRVPLLIVSADDDRFGTATTARFIARQVPTAKLVIYPTGGHIFLGHDADAAQEIAAFVARHAR